MQSICVFRVQDALLDDKTLYSNAEARIIKIWRRFCHTRRLRGSLVYKSPSPEVFIPYPRGWRPRALFRIPPSMSDMLLL